jgi:hypothetical protein
MILGMLEGFLSEENSEITVLNNAVNDSKLGEFDQKTL